MRRCIEEGKCGRPQTVVVFRLFSTRAGLAQGGINFEFLARNYP